jgi:lipoprotein-releasing system permease protein
MRLFREEKKSFSTFIMRLSIAATTISVAAMIIALSFINGFQQVISNKIFSFWGHVRIMHYDPVNATIAEDIPITGNDSIRALLLKNSNVKSVSTFATKSAILSSSGTMEGVLVKGVDRDYPFEKTNRFLIKGDWPSWNDSSNSNEIVISAYTANQLKLDTGKSILIHFIQEDGSSPKTRKLRVSGIFKTGIDIYDKVYAIADIQLIQKLNTWEANQIGGYEIELQDPEQMLQATEDIFQFLPPGWSAMNLKELSPEIFDWLHLQNTNKFILISIMTIVALINLITCLIILVLERTNMIAVLKSLGGTDGMIQQIFVYYGSWVMAIGVSLGVLLGTGLCIIQKYGKPITLNEEAYYISYAPVDINGWQILAIAISTFSAAILILIIPSYLSRKINPIKALQFK